jgi:hypothetical protein
MDTKNQFTVFLLSMAIGAVGGLLYGIFAILRWAFRAKKRKTIGFCLDIGFCICFAVFSVYASFLLHFPAFRGYICIGWGFGGALSLIFLRRIVAFLKKVCYNVFVKMVAKVKSKEKTLHKERIDI